MLPGGSKEQEHYRPEEVYTGRHEEDRLPVSECLVLIDDCPRKGGGQEPHDVCEPVRYPEQSTREVRRHVDMGAHEP